jgi:hypothetical protein
MAIIDRIGRTVSTEEPETNQGEDQEVTSGASVAVGIYSRTVRVNKTVGSATTLVMPTSSTKEGDVLISDWKDDAATNNITIVLSGSDVFPGGLTSWTIASNSGSIRLDPIPGVGYAI